MAKLQVMTLANLTEFKGLYDADIAKKIKEASDKAIKSVSLSSDGNIIYFYKTETPGSEEEADYSINLPAPVDISKKADKVSGAVDGNLAGLDASGNLTDSGKKAADFEVAGAANAAKTEVMEYIGDIPEESLATTIIDFIKEVDEASKYDDTELKGRVTTVEGAITTLNGEGEGSVTKTVADAIAKLVAEAPESFDTLKEISDWITSHSSDAAGMNSKINANEQAINQLKTLLGTLPEGAASSTVVDYITEAINKAIGEIDYSGITDRLTAVEGKVTAVEGKVTTLEGKMTTAEGEIDALQSLVGEGVEAIPSESIQALFVAG